MYIILGMGGGPDAIHSRMIGYKVEHEQQTHIVESLLQTQNVRIAAQLWIAGVINHCIGTP